MQSPSVVGIFCEDIREEKTGQNTIIGILPDNIRVPGIPGILPKLAIYIRVHLDSSSPIPKSITAKLTMPDGADFPLPSWDTDMILKGFSQSKLNGAPLVGLLLRSAVVPFQITKEGVCVAKVNVDGTEYIAANLNITTIPATASSPPP